MKKIAFLVLLIWFLFPATVCAEEIQEETQEQIFEKFEFGEVDQLLNEIFPNQKLGFKETLLGLMSGEVELSLELIKDMVVDQFTYEFQNSKASMIHILIITIIAAVFHNFSGVFQNNQISELSFYVLYMLLITICIDAFRVLMVSVESGLENLLDFLQMLSPIYFMAVAIATGSVTSIAFYNLILLLIYIVESLVQSVLVPLVQIYMVIRILNELSSEEYLSKFADLLQTVIVWSLRTIMGSVVGINIIQGLLSPAIDFVKRSILTKGGEAIPIVGNAVGSVTEIILGTAVLIKNGIGIVGAIICVAICLSPMIQMAVIVILYKLTAALIQPISDKRMVGCISSMADGTALLLRIIFTSCVLFLISIAIVAATTS